MFEAEEFGQAVLVVCVTTALGFDCPSGIVLTADGAFVVADFEVVAFYLFGVLGEGFSHGKSHVLDG